jgi:septal ring factor EnvC (AmiA/AmiB activator)
MYMVLLPQQLVRNQQLLTLQVLCWLSAAGDALQMEQQRAETLEQTTAVLQKRIHNMASVRETSNKQLTGQLSQLKEKLAASRRQQQESAAQVRTLVKSLQDAKRRLKQLSA